MTCTLMTPWWQTREGLPDDTERPAAGSTAATAILDLDAPTVRDLAGHAGRTGSSPGAVVRAAHEWIAHHVRPVYGVEERTPASVVLARRRGSCSQRLALLEAVARASGIATRVHGLEVDGAFWYPRFPALRAAVPSSVVVAWPELFVDGGWEAVDEVLTGRPDPAAGVDVGAFTNADRETLFDAAGRTRIDWTGCTGDRGDACALGGQVRRDLGRFDSRDDLFDRHGQTLHLLARRALDPILSRWSPSA